MVSSLDQVSKLHRCNSEAQLFGSFLPLCLTL